MILFCLGKTVILRKLSTGSQSSAVHPELAEGYERLLKCCIKREHEGRTLIRIALRERHLPEEAQPAIRGQIIVRTYVAKLYHPGRSALKHFR